MGAHQRDVTPDIAINDLIANQGNYQQNYARYAEDVNAMRGQGLPQAVRDIYLKQGKGMIGGQLRSGQQQLRESIAGTGSGVPLDAMMRGLGALQGQANTASTMLTDQVAMKDYDARQRNLDRSAGLAELEQRNLGLRANMIQGAQNTGIEATRQHNESQFSWGKLAGLGLGLGGQFAGGQLGRKGTEGRDATATTGTTGGRR